MNRVRVRPCPCLCVDVDKLLKSPVFDFLVCIFQVGKSQLRFDFKSRIVHNSVFENLAQFRFSNFRQSVELLPEGLLCSRDIGWVKENDV